MTLKSTVSMKSVRISIKNFKGYLDVYVTWKIIQFAFLPSCYLFIGQKESKD